LRRARLGIEGHPVGSGITLLRANPSVVEPPSGVRGKVDPPVFSLAKFGVDFGLITQVKIGLACQLGQVAEVRDPIGFGIVHHQMTIATVAGETGKNLSVPSYGKRGPVAIHFCQAGKNAEIHGGLPVAGNQGHGHTENETDQDGASNFATTPAREAENPMYL
jgi:hypothetical protein